MEVRIYKSHLSITNYSNNSNLSILLVDPFEFLLFMEKCYDKGLYDLAYKLMY
jgi:hypothetical protein